MQLDKQTMRYIKSAMEKTISNLGKFGMDAKSSHVRDDIDYELVSISERLEKIRDNKLVRFVFTVIQSSK